MTDHKLAYALGATFALKNSGLTKEGAWPWEKDRKGAFSSWAPWAAGAGLGLGTYALMRHRFLADPNKFPLLRRMQDMAQGRMVSRVGNAGGATQRVSEVAKDTGGKSLLERLWNRIKTGPEATSEEISKMVEERRAQAAKTPGKKADPVVVFHPTDLPEPGTVNPAIGPYRRGEVGRVNKFNKQVVDDKLRQAQLLAEYAPDSVARTMDIKDVLTKYKIKIDPRNPSKGLSRLQEALKTEMGGNPYLIKTRGPRKFGDPAAQSHLSSFPDESSDLNELYRQWKGMRRKFLDVASEDQNEAVQQFRGMKGYAGRVIDEILHNNAMVQERMPIAKYRPSVARKMEQMDLQPTKEYRVHSFGGKVIPELSLPRYYPGLLDLIPAMIRAQKAGRTLQATLDKMPEKYRNIPFAADIADLEGGAQKIIELNQGGRSGFLTYPMLRHGLSRAMEGRFAEPIAAAGAVGAAGLGTAGTGVGMNLAQD